MGGKGGDTLPVSPLFIGKEEIPGEFRWSIQEARKQGRKGRAMGSIWMGIRRGHGSGGRRDETGRVNNKRDKLGRRKVEDGNGVYKRKYGKILEKVKGKAEDKKGEKSWIVGGLQCKDGRERGVGRRRGRKGGGGVIEG